MNSSRIPPKRVKTKKKKKKTKLNADADAASVNPNVALNTESVTEAALKHFLVKS